MIKAFVTDLDGTLLPQGGSISPQNLRSLERSGQQGVVRIIATGRSLYAARKVLPEDFPIDYLVFSSGAGILRWQDQQLLYTRHLQPLENQEIATYLWDFHINFTVQKEIPDNHHFYYTEFFPLHEDYKHRLQTYQPFGTPLYAPDELQESATQFIMILDARQLRLLEQIRKELHRYSIVRSTSPVDNRAIWLEIFPQGVNKGNSCLHLFNELGISPCHTAGLGNDYNDVDFLDLCQQAFLVANAPVRLRPHYKSVASDRNNGFTEFIDQIL